MSACNAGDLGSITGSRRSPWRRKWQPTPVFMPEESHGQRSLIGYSPWGHKESDMTERLHFHLTPLQVGATHLPKVAGQTALENQGLIGQRASQECLFCHRRPAQQITLWGITYSTHHHTHTHRHTHLRCGQSTCPSFTYRPVFTAHLSPRGQGSYESSKTYNVSILNVCTRDWSETKS